MPPSAPNSASNLPEEQGADGGASASPKLSVSPKLRVKRAGISSASEAPRWYAREQLADLDGWDEQDPELYRSMAAPRPEADAVSADVQIIEDDDDYVFDGDALSSAFRSTATAGVRAPLRPLADRGLDDLDDLDALESLNPFDLSPSFLEDAGLLPETSIEDLGPPRPQARAETIDDPPTAIPGHVPVRRSVPPEPDRAAGTVTSFVMIDAPLDGEGFGEGFGDDVGDEFDDDEEALITDLGLHPVDVDSLLPGASLKGYEDQCRLPRVTAEGGTQLGRQLPARIARRLWQRGITEGHR